MHQEDLAEEERIVAELAAPAVTRSQSAQVAATRSCRPAFGWFLLQGETPRLLTGQDTDMNLPSWSWPAPS